MEKNIRKYMRSVDCIAAHYRQRNTRVRDHCFMVNPGWRRILDLIEADQRVLNWSLIQISWVDALTANDLVSLS